MTVGGSTSIGDLGALNLTGGRLEFGAMSLEDFAQINGVSGSLAGELGEIVLTGFNHIGDVALAGGEITNLSADVDVSEVVFSYSNSGVLYGDGATQGTLINNPTGVVEVITSERMQFARSGTNAGQITLAGGQVQFAEGFSNLSTGLVMGDGGLRADGGMINDGTMAFSATTRVIGDVTNNATGLISSSGGTTTFFDDVTNNGEIRTNANSFTVYFGSYSGSGDTGTGTVIMEGDLKPGSSPGLMEFGGDLVYGSRASTEIEVGGLTPGIDLDQITVAHELALDGDLLVTLINGFVPMLGSSFDLMTASSITGAFDNVTLPGVGYELLYTPTSVQLIATSSLAGDYNNNGVVDSADYAVWLSNLGAPAGTLLNDTTGGAIGVAQYSAWKNNFGAALSSTALSPANVPEPTSLVLLCLGGLLVAQCRQWTARNKLSPKPKEPWT